MTRLKKAIAVRSVLAVIFLVGIAPASAAAPVKSNNVKHVANFRYDGGGELAAHGRFLYSSEANAEGGEQRNTKPEDGGLHIYDAKTMKEI